MKQLAHDSSKTESLLHPTCHDLRGDPKRPTFLGLPRRATRVDPVIALRYE